MGTIDSDFRLAIHGGNPVFAEGPPTWPEADEAVRAALEAAWADGSWGRYDGPYGRSLAQRLAEMHGLSHVRCCCSGTVAVELALRGLQVSAGDEVILAGYDFPGNFRAVEALGAIPVLVDICRRSWCLDATCLEAARGPRVRAIIVSHLHGGLAAMPQIRAWADRYKVAVVEDACQAPGAMIEGRLAGAWGHVGVLSFGGSKLLSAGRGGAVLTSRTDVLQRIKIYSDRGNQAYPLSELQAAVLLPQLERLAERNQRRLENATRLVQLCSEFSVLEPVTRDSATNAPSFYKLGWLLAGEQAAANRDEFLAAVRAEGVALDEGFRSFALRSNRRCRKIGDLPNSREAARATVLLHHPILIAEPPPDRTSCPSDQQGNARCVRDHVVARRPFCGLPPSGGAFWESSSPRRIVTFPGALMPSVTRLPAIRLTINLTLSPIRISSPSFRVKTNMASPP